MSTEMDNSHAESRGCGREDGHTRPPGMRAPERGGGLRKISLIPANSIAAPALPPEIKSTKGLRITVEKRCEIIGVDPPQLALKLKKQM